MLRTPHGLMVIGFQRADDRPGNNVYVLDASGATVVKQTEDAWQLAPLTPFAG